MLEGSHNLEVHCDGWLSMIEVAELDQMRQSISRDISATGAVAKLGAPKSRR